MTMVSRRIVMTSSWSMLHFQWLKGKETRIIGAETGSSPLNIAAFGFAVWAQAAGKRQDNASPQSISPHPRPFLRKAGDSES